MRATYASVGVDELGARVAQEQGHDGDLAPLIRVQQLRTQLAVPLVNHVQAVRTHFVERHDHAPLGAGDTAGGAGLE